MNKTIDTSTSYDDIIIYDKMFQSEITVPTDIYKKACMQNDSSTLHAIVDRYFQENKANAYDDFLLNLDKQTIKESSSYSTCKVTFVVNKKKASI